MESIRRNNKSMFSLIQAKILTFVIFISFVFNFSFFSLPILAQKSAEAADVNEYYEEFGDLDVAKSEIDPKYSLIDDKSILYHLPENEDIGVKSSGFRVITAYNSEVGQTDNSPCITANSFNLCEHGFEDSIAANFLPFGAKVKIPDLFGDRVFIVRDRMHKRFSDRVDIWMVERSDAVNFGAKYAKVEVLNNN